AITVAELSNDDIAAGQAHYVLAREGVWTGRFAAGLESGRRATALLEQAGERWWLVFAYCWLGSNYAFLADFISALEATDRALEHAESLDDVRMQAYAINQAGWITAMRGEGRQAVALADRALGLATDPLASTLATAVLGLGLTECAEYEAARLRLDEAIKGMDRFGYRRLVCWYTAWRAEAWLGMGELERSEGDAREALAASLALGSPWGAAISERTLGRVATARESLSAGGQHLMRALGILERIEARLEIAVTRFDLARVAFLEGD